MAAVGAPTPLLERHSPNLIPELKRYVATHRAQVETMVRQGGATAGLPAGTRHAKMFDGLLASLFCAAEAIMKNESTWTSVALAGVGSYGRGAIAYHSDLDVRILCSARPERARPIAEALLYPLWDAGLTIGHQVVTGAEMIELAANDLPTATSLLDWRVIVGEGSTTEKMLARVYDGLFGISTIQRFLDQLTQQSAEREDRYGGSVYLLEPEVKSGTGGMRDLDMIHWAARARWRVRGIADLVRIGVLVPREYQLIADAASMIWRVRNLLHVHAGRRSDRLSFDRQESLALELGYGSGGPGVEHFMSDYYRHARVLSKSREMVLARAAPPPKRRPRETPIGRGLKLTNDQVSIADPGALEREPALALRLYDEAVTRGAKVYPFARDLVARATTSPTFCGNLRESDEAAKLFVKLATVVRLSPFHEGSVLAELHDVGLLVAMIPEFAPVVGRVHHDVYHVYTVDVHSVAAVDKLRALCRGDLAAEHPLASRLAAEIQGRRVLMLATLLHDVGKDIGGRNHSERGAQLARGILERLHFAEEDILAVQYLVQSHLKMYLVATRRDIDDPKTLEAFCEMFHGHEGLRDLYLLTVADVSTTSPTALTSWKARMLEELYVCSERYLDGGVVPSKEERAEAVRSRVLELCPERGERDFLSYYLSTVPERYLTGNDAEDILRHSRFARQSQMQSINIAVLGDTDPYVELGFIADDRPGLLAMITATLAAARIKIMSAQIYSWRDAFGRARVLDLFWVKGGVTSRTVQAALPRLHRDFSRLTSHELSPAELVTGQRTSRLSDRPTPTVRTDVNFDNRASSDHTVIEIITRDRSGLLFWLSNALQQSGLTISLAKINTEGTQVADVFYVTGASGGKVTDPERIEMLKGRLLSTIARLQEAVS